MASILDTLRVLLDHFDSIEGTYSFFASEQDDWVQGEEAARDQLYQWASDVAGVLKLAKRSDDLNVWQDATRDIKTLQIGTIISSAQRMKALFLQIRSGLYNDSLPSPNDDMPKGARADYEEAMAVFIYSSRSAAALLRLAIQKLCGELGEKGRDLNDDIKGLVAKGLPMHIQKALDIVRMVGNDAVHPGVLDIRDNPDLAFKLFGLVNLIVEDRITQKKRIDILYGALPDGARKAIGERDKKK